MSLSDVPNDVTRSVLYLLDDESLLTMCSLNENFNKGICNDVFWINKIRSKFPLTTEDIRKYSVWGGIMNYYFNLQEELSGDVNLMMKDAAKRGRLDLIKIALVDPRLDKKLSAAASLNIAAYAGHIDVVKFLLEQGVDVHFGRDLAITRAALAGRTEIVRVLLENGANPTSALYAAARNESEDIVVLLLNYGANWREALDTARHFDNHKMIEYLERIINFYLPEKDEFEDEFE